MQRLSAASATALPPVDHSLALDDVRDATRLLRSEYDRAGEMDEFISFECMSDLADDAEAAIAHAIDLWRRLHPAQHVISSAHPPVLRR